MIRAFVECRVDAKLRTPPEEDVWSEQDEEERQGRKGSMMRTFEPNLRRFPLAARNLKPISGSGFIERS